MKKKIKDIQALIEKLQNEVEGKAESDNEKTAERYGAVGDSLQQANEALDEAISALES